MSLSDLYLLGQIWVWTVVAGLLVIAFIIARDVIELGQVQNGTARSNKLKLRLLIVSCAYLVLLAYALWIEPWSFLF